jgi:pyruvate,orthophosphate dikinase
MIPLVGSKQLLPQVAGLTYVCCSPFRVPVARLAAAQAAIADKQAAAAQPAKTK